MGRNWKRQPVTVRGVEYPSHTHAAKALCVSVKAVTNAQGRDRLDTLGLGHVAGHKKQVAIKGAKFPEGKSFRSLKEAAAAVGESVTYLYRLRSQARCDGKTSCKGRFGIMAWLD